LESLASGSLPIASPQDRRSPVDCILFAIAIAPAIYLAWLISQTAVNILLLDEWDYIFLFRHLTSHSLTLHDLLQQHNESRTTLPNLIVLGLGSLTHWDVRWDMWVMFFFACVISINIYFLSRRTFTRRQSLCLWVIANVLIFSTEQNQNWLWGIQMIVFMPILFITTGMVIAYSRISTAWKFIACMTLATASTFSYANGQLAWVVLLGALIFGSAKKSARIVWLILLYLAGFAANLLLYYHDYHPPGNSPSMSIALKKPIAAMEYFAGFLGASLGEGMHQFWISVGFGLVLIAWTIITCAIVWRERARTEWLQSASIWLLIAAYTLASGAITTAGRLGFGLKQSQDSRYTTFSLYLVVALLYLGAMIVRDVYHRRGLLSASICASLGLALILIPQFWTQTDGNRQMWAARRANLTGKAVAELNRIDIVPGWLYPVPSKITNEVGFLDQMGYLSPGLVKDRDLSRIEDDNAGKFAGYLDSIVPQPYGTWLARGWAINALYHEPAVVVVLAGDDLLGHSRGFAIAGVGGMRLDVAAIEKDRRYKLCGWGVFFSLAKVPPGTVAISAWAFNPLTGLAYRLAGSAPWNNAKTHAAG